MTDTTTNDPATAPRRIRRTGGATPEELRDDSVLLNELGWRMAVALGDVSLGNELVADPSEQLERLIARVTGPLAEVAAERVRQTAKHGDQTHLLDGTGPDQLLLAADGMYPELGETTFAALARAQRDTTDARSQSAGDGTVTFADVLLEEVFEAVAEDDVDLLRAELVQVAAVCVQWVEAIDARGAR